MKLTRTAYTKNGIFGVLQILDGSFRCQTLEHAYNGDGSYAAKIPNGTYECVRGEHLLEGMTTPFVTFEITGVVGHTGLLFHWGNWNKDSSGCVLLGFKNENDLMILDSKLAFDAFMASREGMDKFLLVVE